MLGCYSGCVGFEDGLEGCWVDCDSLKRYWGLEVAVGEFGFRSYDG